MAPPDLPLQNGTPSPRETRSQSISSDKISLTGHSGLLSPPLTINPAAGFIAASAASQIVTNDHDSRSDSWLDQHGIEPSGETALVSQPALKLVNRFLDQLLLNFLSMSKSTSLASLRPAVSEVLKTKLAKDAVSGADQELHEYLGGGEDEELMAFHHGTEPSGSWDLELVWKRTRLRCMVYSSLGDMEEEDEDFYTDKDQLDGPPGSTNRYSNNPGVVSPAVAIFLTSILEFMGEQVLVVAGQAAYNRLKAKHEKEEKDGTNELGDLADRVVVEESDMERVALDRTLGRLWRGWKKRVRSPTNSVSMGRSFSRESLSPGSRAGNSGAEDVIAEDGSQPSLATVLAEHEHAARIPLPISDDDVREIEIPGLATQSDDGQEDCEDEDDQLPTLRRPKSLEILPYYSRDPLTPAQSQPSTPFLALLTRIRSNSLPSPRPSPYKAFSKPVEVPAAEAEMSAAPVVDGQDSEKEVGTPEKAEPKSEDKILEDEVTTEPGNNKGLVAGALAGGVAAVTAVVTGLTGKDTDKFPPTNMASTDEHAADDNPTDDEVVEEPQILTSSRVSMPGRFSPEHSNLPSRRSSVRSHSVHSIRVVDVPSTKSPNRSRHSSMNADELISGQPLSRNSNNNSPLHLDSATPRVSSPVMRIGAASPISRNNSSLSQRQIRHNAKASISEEKEAHDADVQEERTPVTAKPTDFAGAMQGVDVNIPSNSENSVAKPATTPAPFVLSAAPVTRQLRANAAATTAEPAQTNGNLKAPSKTLGAEHGVPPLTPLREMMEGAPDTSDEASSVSNYSRSVSEHGAHGHSPTVSASSIKGQVPRGPEQPRSTRGQPTNRPSPPRTSRDESSRKDSIKLQRPTHTSGSISSTTSHKLKPVRTSEESTQRTFEDKGQSFEQLMRSDQTIQYTLTPQNMRNIEAPESPRQVAQVITNGQIPRPPTGRSHSSSVSKPVPQPIEPSPKSPKLTKSFKPIPRPVSSTNTGSKVRSNAPQARDARVDMRDSMGDFAEFIRSTGPANSNQPPPRPLQPSRSTNGFERSVSGASAQVAPGVSSPRRTDSVAGRPKLQARDAMVSRGDSISDIIDFVRSGPQLEKENHRIPRTVAPFRTTMDSDQMSGAGGRALDASIPGDSRYSQASTSIQSSVNSQSALLNHATKNKPSQPNNLQLNIDEEDLMPKRKTRRVRDPYAIDFSDEEDEFDVAAVLRPQPIQEESLADFLRNVPPPQEPKSPTVVENASRPSSKSMKKKSSTPSFKSRFGRKSSNASLPGKITANGNDSHTSITRPAGSPKPPAPTPIAAMYSTNGAGSSYASQVDTARNKVVQKNYQPREAVYSSHRTNDLAEFLRNNEPPSSMQTQPQTFTPTLQKDEGAFQRMFGRKKVH